MCGGWRAMNEKDAKLQAELEAMAARAGVTIPEQRLEAFFAAFRDFRAAIQRLDRPRSHDVEIAGQFSAETIRKGAP